MAISRGKRRSAAPAVAGLGWIVIVGPVLDRGKFGQRFCQRQLPPQGRSVSDQDNAGLPGWLRRRLRRRGHEITREQAPVWHRERPMLLAEMSEWVGGLDHETARCLA
jgi:hypothetical protein